MKRDKGYDPYNSTAAQPRARNERSEHTANRYIGRMVWPKPAQTCDVCGRKHSPEVDCAE